MLDASLVPNSSNINILAVNSSAHCPLIHKGLGSGFATPVIGSTCAVGILKAASTCVAVNRLPDKTAIAAAKFAMALNLNGDISLIMISISPSISDLVILMIALSLKVLCIKY